MEAIIIDGEHQYDLKTVGDMVGLYYSSNPYWHHPGELVLGLKDDGNGYKLVKPLRKRGRIDYDEAQELLILLHAVKGDSKIEIYKKSEEL